MSSSAYLLDQVLSLPASERADLARQVLLSLENEPLSDPAEIDRLWSNEIDTRLDRADAQNSTEIDWRDAVDRVRNEIRKDMP